MGFILEYAFCSAFFALLLLCLFADEIGKPYKNNDAALVGVFLFMFFVLLFVWPVAAVYATFHRR